MDGCGYAMVILVFPAFLLARTTRHISIFGPACKRGGKVHDFSHASTVARCSRQIPASHEPSDRCASEVDMALGSPPLSLELCLIAKTKDYKYASADEMDNDRHL